MRACEWLAARTHAARGAVRQQSERTVKRRSHSDVCCSCRTMSPQLGSIRGMRSCAGSRVGGGTATGTGTASTGQAHAGDEHAACTWDGCGGATAEASAMRRARGGTGGGGVTGRGCSSLSAASIVGGSDGAAVAVAAGRGAWASVPRGVFRMGRGAGAGVAVAAALLPPGGAGCAGDAFARANSWLSSGCWNDTLDGVRGWRCVGPPVAVAVDVDADADAEDDATAAACAVHAICANPSGGSSRALSAYNTSALMLRVVQCDRSVQRHGR